MRATRPFRIACLLLAGGLFGCSNSDGTSGGLGLGENAPPVVTIANPADGSEFTEGDPVPFQGSAIDAEDGILPGESLRWNSHKDGDFATGTNPTVTTLSPGGHAITLTATDSEGLSKSETVTITIEARPPEPPIASIVQPLADEVFAQGVEVVLLGSGDDPDGPDLEESAFVWSSNRDGEIGTGRLVGTSTLSVGDHLITLTVRDRDGIAGTATVVITITP
jgi:PKD repeat protein